MAKDFKQVLKLWAISHPFVFRFLTMGGEIKVKGRNNHCSNHALSMRGCTIAIKGNNNQIEIGKGVRMKNVKIEITGDGHRLKIGEGVRFVHGGRIRMEDVSNAIEIGSDTTINDAFLSASDKNTKITIGHKCLFSVDIILRTSDSHSIFPIDGNNRINMGKDIVIGDHVWLCNGVNVLKGVTIGSGSVVGTQSVVTKDISPNSIACGNPAKVVKTDIRWDTKRVFE